jgi:hypothetical protein
MSTISVTAKAVEYRLLGSSGAITMVWNIKFGLIH